MIKVLPPELASEVSATRFKKEIEVAAQMQHPHIVPILAAASRDELLWDVMPYVRGESLRHRLEASGHLPVRGILHSPLSTLAELLRGRVAEKLGDKARARDAYAFVADLWQHGDPEFQRYVAEARAGLTRLSGESAGTTIPLKKP